jgi:hypothetical protein
LENININLVLILAIIIVLIIFTSSFIHKRRKSSSIVILDRIREINEYASHELNYFENVSHEEAMRLFNHDIPFIKKGFSITVIGKVKIGINMDNVKVSVFNKNLYITIPEIKIISHETKTSEIGFQSKNPFFQNDLGDFNEKLEEMKTVKEKEILQDTELIEKIYEDLKKKITDSLLALPHFSKKFTVHYKTGTPVLLIEDTRNQ